jgi:HlyD family secretion protein
MSTIAVPNGSKVRRIIDSLPAGSARWILLLFLLLACGIAGALVAIAAHANASYVTVPVAQQTLVQTVTASGTVNPQNDISVGTQVSGTISSIDVDYNSKVRNGQVLARLDPSAFEAQLDQAQAALAQAQAQYAQAQANAGSAVSGTEVAVANAGAAQAAVAAAQANANKAQAALALANTTLERDSSLLAQGYLPQSTVDTDRSNVAQDDADLASAQASIAQARAQAEAGSATVDENGSTQAAQAAAAQAALANIAAAKAVVQQDELNLQHSVITSPVDGTVVARDVSVGQTVAASLQTPTLFSIAQNLGKMEVDINVGEPDVGNVKPGETVDFSVLAYPNRTFRGTVSQVRINPQTVNNVVTYDVVVLVDNKDGALLPGMTANASIDVATANNALVVPLSALTWHPSNLASKASGAVSPNAASVNPSSPWGATSAGAGSSSAITSGSNGAVFVDAGRKLQRVPVSVTLVTSTQAAIVPATVGTLSSGDSVVVASSGASSGTVANATRSPISASPGGTMRGLH